MAGAELAANGAIAVDERLATSVPAIWAVGDCAAVRHAVTGEHAYMPLGSLANRQGRTLANILAGRRDTFPRVAGAAAAKVFDLNVGATGCTERRALELGININIDNFQEYERLERLVGEGLCHDPESTAVSRETGPGTGIPLLPRHEATTSVLFHK